MPVGISKQNVDSIALKGVVVATFANHGKGAGLEFPIEFNWHCLYFRCCCN
jgi:hypothetical protein